MPTPTSTHSHSLSSTRTHSHSFTDHSLLFPLFFSLPPLMFRLLGLILSAYAACLTHCYSTSKFSHPIHPITYDFNQYSVPVFYMPTRFTYLYIWAFVFHVPMCLRNSFLCTLLPMLCTYFTRLCMC